MENENSPVDDASSEAGRQWYSVKEAAAYLGISQPTLFRWMKEGTLSFYKVGGATRFSREGLDAVIEKSTGRKEAEAAAGRCAACGHGVLLPGRIQGMGKLYFHPDKTRFWTLEESLVPTQARVCPACGYLHLYADPEKVRRLEPRRAEEIEAEEGS